MMKDRSDSEDEESSSPTQSPENTLFSQEKVKKIWWIIVSSSVISPPQAPMTPLTQRFLPGILFQLFICISRRTPRHHRPLVWSCLNLLTSQADCANTVFSGYIFICLEDRRNSIKRSE